MFESKGPKLPVGSWSNVEEKSFSYQHYQLPTTLWGGWVSTHPFENYADARQNWIMKPQKDRAENFLKKCWSCPPPSNQPERSGFFSPKKGAISGRRELGENGLLVLQRHQRAGSGSSCSPRPRRALDCLIKIHGKKTNQSTGFSNGLYMTLCWGRGEVPPSFFVSFSPFHVSFSELLLNKKELYTIHPRLIHP